MKVGLIMVKEELAVYRSSMKESGISFEFLLDENGPVEFTVVSAEQSWEFPIIASDASSPIEGDEMILAAPDNLSSGARKLVAFSQFRMLRWGTTFLVALAYEERVAKAIMSKEEYVEFMVTRAENARGRLAYLDAQGTRLALNLNEEGYYLGCAMWERKDPSSSL